MGLTAGYLAFKGEASQPWRPFLMTGVPGGYTTFSAFSLDAATLHERGALALAAAYVLGSAVLSIAGLFAGVALIRYLSRSAYLVKCMGPARGRMGWLALPFASLGWAA